MTLEIVPDFDGVRTDHANDVECVELSFRAEVGARN
jgi:hypothetical protein